MEQRILNYLKDNGYDLECNSSKGLTLALENDELLISGNKLDLIELADYILDIALLNNNHVHLDDLTLLDKDSSITNLIIEKKE